MIAKTKLCCAVLILGSMLSQIILPVQASSTINIQSAKVAVEDRNSRTQRAATRQALTQLLIKFTGQGDISSYQALKTISDDANRYLRAYRYTEENGQLYFVAEFDRQQLETVLKRERLPIWGDRRPDALLWLATENDKGERRITGDGQVNEFAITARREAEARGVPLTFPLMDLDDAARINAFDVWGLFPRQLNLASVRYNVDFVLGARIYRNRTRDFVLPGTESAANASEVESETPTVPQSDYVEPQLEHPLQQAETVQEALLALPEGQITPVALDDGPLFTQEEFSTLAARAKKGRYSLDFFYVPFNGASSQVVHGTLIGDEPNELIKQLINRYADHLGQTYAILPGDANSEQRIELSVGNLHDLRGYVAVQQYLQALSVTESVTLVRQQGTVSTFSLHLLGSEKDLRAVLSLDNRLQPLRDAFGQPLEGMHYFWSQ